MTRAALAQHRGRLTTAGWEVEHGFQRAWRSRLPGVLCTWPSAADALAGAWTLNPEIIIVLQGLENWRQPELRLYRL